MSWDCIPTFMLCSLYFSFMMCIYLFIQNPNTIFDNDQFNLKWINQWIITLNKNFSLPHFITEIIFFALKTLVTSCCDLKIKFWLWNNWKSNKQFYFTILTILPLPQIVNHVMKRNWVSLCWDFANFPILCSNWMLHHRQ